MPMRSTSSGSPAGLGGGVPENAAEAARWLRMAAEQGHAIAQHSLGAAALEELLGIAG